jgi:hypothetical protein
LRDATFDLTRADRQGHMEYASGVIPARQRSNLTLRPGGGAGWTHRPIRCAASAHDAWLENGNPRRGDGGVLLQAKFSIRSPE